MGSLAGNKSCHGSQLTYFHLLMTELSSKLIHFHLLFAYTSRRSATLWKNSTCDDQCWQCIVDRRPRICSYPDCIQSCLYLSSSGSDEYNLKIKCKGECVYQSYCIWHLATNGFSEVNYEACRHLSNWRLNFTVTNGFIDNRQQEKQEVTCGMYDISQSFMDEVWKRVAVWLDLIAAEMLAFSWNLRGVLWCKLDMHWLCCTIDWSCPS